MKKLLTLLLSIMMCFCLANINENTVKADGTYTVTVNLNGGSASTVPNNWSGSDGVYTRQFAENTTYETILKEWDNKFSHPSQAFKGWYPGKSNTALTEATTFTAQWKDASYLTFTSQENGSTIKFSWIEGSDVMYKASSTSVLYGGSNASTSWSTYTASTVITLPYGEKVSFKGNGVRSDASNKFVMTGKIAASGDITSLLNGNSSNPGGDVAIPKTTQFSNMFRECEALTSVPNLPSTSLKTHCYLSMFHYCVNLTSIPVDLLPAATVYESCYNGMFFWCSKLKNVPNLPATTLAQSCYQSMFGGCISLKSVPKNLLQAATLGTHCYREMFSGCESLANVPDLPATSLVDHCYYKMFAGCTSIYLGTTDQSLGSIVFAATNPTSPANDEVTEMIKYTDGDVTHLTPTITNPAKIYYYQKYHANILTISDISPILYDGTEKRPTFTVVDNYTENPAKTLIEGTDYTVAYSDNTSEGTATITITTLPTSKYAGTSTVVTFEIYTPKTSSAQNQTTPVVAQGKDESCEAVIGPRWHWNEKTGKCVEEYSVINTATK